MAHIEIEGQTFELPDELVQTDDLLKRALTPYYPNVANAAIQRRPLEGGDVKITVIKRPGVKGALDDVQSRLAGAPHQMNPAVQLFHDLQARSLTPEQIILMQAEIEAAVEHGQREQAQVRAAMQHLHTAPAVPATTTPIGL